MRIAIASGKGGAGKTTITASLAAVWDAPFIAVDTDVEAPNLHLFLRPDILREERVDMEVPVLENRDRCTLCGSCADICRYRAIARFPSSLHIFPEMCHGCGGCFAVCAPRALSVGRRELGVLEEGVLSADSGGGGGRFLMGRTRIGEAMTPPLLRALIRRLDDRLSEANGSETPPDALMDAPPGVSCPAMTVARDADLILLAADPTPFGFHDFRLAHLAFRPLARSMAVVISRAGMPGNEKGDESVRAYCAENDLPLLAELPFERTAADNYARGRVLSLTSPAWRERFELLRDRLRKRERNVDREAPHA